VKELYPDGDQLIEQQTPLSTGPRVFLLRLPESIPGLEKRPPGVKDQGVFPISSSRPRETRRAAIPLQTLDVLPERCLSSD